MIKNILVLLLLFASQQLFAQQYTLINSIEIGERKFTTDPLGNIYIYSSGDITKINPENTILWKYSSREYGDLGFVDASNPLKVLAVFPDFSKAVFLDAALAANTTVDLNFPGIPFVRLICNSRDNGFWIFDPLEKRLRKYNDQLVILSEGTPLRQVSEDEIVPTVLHDGGNWIVLNDTTYGMLVFDRYGTYYKTIRPPIVKNIQVSEDGIMYQAGENMMVLDIKTGAERKFMLPGAINGDDCRVEGNRIFIRQKGLLNIYSY